MPPRVLVVHPSGKFAYVTYGPFESKSVAMYSIDATTGDLTSIGTIAAEGYPISVTVDPMGKFAYVTMISTTLELASRACLCT